MLLKRVIPSLLFSNDGLYKTINYKNKKYIGDVVNTIRLFNDMEVDELVILDIEATKSCKGPNLELIKDIASECFMPLCYGGGIKSVTDAGKVFSLGVEKICINSQALVDLKLITELSNIFGSQSIVVSVDTKKNIFGNIKLFSYINNVNRKFSVVEYAKRIENAGAGEIFLTSVNHEGKMKGFDLKTISELSGAINIPLIAHGGGGNIEHLLNAFDCGASAVSCGSQFIYQGPHKAVLVNYLTNEEFRVINPLTN